MDTSLIKQRTPLLINRLKRHKFSRAWFSSFKTECSKLCNEASKYNTVEEYIAMVQDAAISGTAAWRRVTCIRAIYRYVTEDVLPNHILFKTKCALTPYYNKLLESGISVARDNGKSEKTLQNYKDTITTFFRHLEANKVRKLDAVPEDVILSYFNGAKKRGHTTSRLILRFFDLLKDQVGADIVQRISSFIPRVQKQHKVYIGLTEKERNAVENVILNGHDSLKLKDRAICALAFYTGIRSCDIINLRFSNIDWKKQRITIIQRKTQRELVLPLLPCYGNLIYDYLKMERPMQKDNDLIFLRNLQKGQMTSHDTYRCTVNVLHAANIRNERIKCGIHLLRHSLATALIVKNTNFAIISATLGHKSTHSTYTYLDSETEGLRQCALSINDLPQINNNFFRL